MFSLRSARPGDAEAATTLLRRSIIELCFSDHQNDEASLAPWLANKKPKIFSTWIANPNNHIVVAEENNTIIGVGMVGRNGCVSLLYLLPGMQRRGVGRALYDALETQAKNWGLRQLTAGSTTGACAFYQAMGFRSTGPAVFVGKARSWPYEKVF